MHTTVASTDTCTLQLAGVELPALMLFQSQRFDLYRYKAAATTAAVTVEDAAALDVFLRENAAACQSKVWELPLLLTVSVNHWQAFWLDGHGQE